MSAIHSNEPIDDVVARVLRRWGEGYVVDAKDAVTLAREVERLTGQADRHRVLIASLLARADTSEAEVARLRDGIEALANERGLLQRAHMPWQAKLMALLAPTAEEAPKSGWTDWPSADYDDD